MECTLYNYILYTYFEECVDFYFFKARYYLYGLYWNLSILVKGENRSLKMIVCVGWQQGLVFRERGNDLANSEAEGPKVGHPALNSDIFGQGKV